jgi:hypothetical protein
MKAVGIGIDEDLILNIVVDNVFRRPDLLQYAG